MTKGQMVYDGESLEISELEAQEVDMLSITLPEPVRTFADRIAFMNDMYKMPAFDKPTIAGDIVDRLTKWKKVISDEVNEIDEIVEAGKQDASTLDILVMLADLLGDITVYVRSEALKYGIPLEEVLEIIMDSNESKLGADGKPIYNEDGSKFLKGPNYWKPEPKIKALLEAKMYGTLSGDEITN